MFYFSVYNIKFAKHVTDDCLVVSGEIHNDSSKSYNTAIFHLRLYVGQECLGSALIKLRGFRSRAGKTFEVIVEGVPRDFVSKIARCEILFDSAY